MNKELTSEEKGVVKDILKIIGNDRATTRQLAKQFGMTVKAFDAITDSIFAKLQDGRLTVIQG